MGRARNTALAAASTRAAVTTGAPPPQPRRTAKQASDDIFNRAAHVRLGADPLIEHPEFAKSRARVTKWARNQAVKNGGTPDHLQDLRDVGLVIIEEMAAVRALDAAAARNREVSIDDLTAVLESEEYTLTRPEQRGGDARMGLMFETVAHRCASLKGAQYQHRGNLLMSPQLSTDASGGVPQSRQHYSDGALKPMVITDLNETAIRKSAEKLAGGVTAKKRTLPKFGSPDFQDLLVQEMERVRKAPRGPVWGQNVDMALTESGTELLELKIGGEPGDKGFEGELKSLISAALAYNDPDVQLRFGLAKKDLDEVMTYYPACLDFKSPLRPVLSGAAWWEHVLPGSVSFKDFIECIDMCGKAFKKDFTNNQFPTTPRARPRRR